jgi:UDP-N-acetyl-D-glucosamine dehydrogenase
MTSTSLSLVEGKGVWHRKLASLSLPAKSTHLCRGDWRKRSTCVYKKNVGDMRESPALHIIELLEERGAERGFYDPFVEVIPPAREHARLAGRKSLPWSDSFGASWDAGLIVTDHDGVNYAAPAEASPLVVDTRNACRKAGVTRPNVILA